MIGIIILTFLSIAFAAACITLRGKNKSFEGMICKFMASFSFIGVAIVGNYLNKDSIVSYFSLICFALLFGFCGDVFLGIKEIAPLFKKKLVPIGTGYFLIGHIVYIIAFFIIGAKFITAIAFPIGMLVAFILMKANHVNLGKAFSALLFIYYGCLVWKMGIGIQLVITDFSIANLLILIATVLFLVSDTCLSYIYFTPVKKKNALVMVELSTYYPAQLLFALSVFFMNK